VESTRRTVGLALLQIAASYDAIAAAYSPPAKCRLPSYFKVNASIVMACWLSRMSKAGRVREGGDICITTAVDDGVPRIPIEWPCAHPTFGS
jgi:hypothetical protein